ncbi:sulfite exporter TauE/SafE [Variibacter gotjawalensis]|uniref:Probable membrane transporter protein n=1 Tax=Variibacter gotjawalensis TaxID=1333996 RepID=A0A0S3PYZ4_9BRAD|nr:sulfite exporter TauE/SafE family protein [Variibacter gotjawalensis]NIK47017.1 putative membrane protein YfcA [Variibacter gotjawalensis]RZS48922.1 putative membrane protein YfcA [Variibacter gotjawalensis]BAT61180.1 sulfite exporter TauE/SafE [Variibacter gotjawalensis]
MPASELALLAALIIAGGALTGLLAGVFGVGGGGIIVPVLYEVFRAAGVPEDVRMQLCVGTSLAIILPTSIRAFMTHRRALVLSMDVFRRWLIPIVVGVALGGFIAAIAPGWVFKISFVVVASLLAAKMFIGSDTWRLGETLPGRWLMSLYGFVIGLYSALMGVGGGSVATLVLTLYGTPIHTAIGYSSGVGVVIAIAGTISFIIAGIPHLAMLPPFSLGFVSLIGLFLMAPITSLVAPYGARLAHKLSRRKLEILFGLFLSFVTLRFVASLIW